MNWFNIIINLAASIITRRNTADNSQAGAVSEPLQGKKSDKLETQSLPLTAKPDFDESRIEQDYSVTQKWHTGWKRPLEQITEVVIHHTDGTGNIETLKRWMLGGERKAQYVKGISLFHFAIDRNGKIWKAGPLSRWWYHSCSGKYDRFTVGIEIIHKSGAFTDAQYENLFWMLFEYMPNFCTSYQRIVSHDYNYNTYSKIKKGCPGPDFDWKRLEAEMVKRGIVFETRGFEEYSLKFPV